MITPCRTLIFFVSAFFVFRSAYSSEAKIIPTSEFSAQKDSGIVIKAPEDAGSLNSLPFIIETKRLIIAPVLTQEMRQVIPELLLCSDPGALTTLFKISDSGNFTLEELLIWIQDDYLLFKGEQQHRFLAFKKEQEDLVPVGMLALDKITGQDEAGLNTCLYISDQGQRLGLELSEAVIFWIRKQTEYSFIETNVLPDNPAAVAICNRFGFDRVRSSKESYLAPFPQSHYLEMKPEERAAFLSTTLKKRTVNCDYYRLNL